MKTSESDRHFPQEDYAVPDARNARIVALEVERIRLMAEVVLLRERLVLQEKRIERMAAIALKGALRRAGRATTGTLGRGR